MRSKTAIRIIGVVAVTLSATTSGATICSDTYAMAAQKLQINTVGDISGERKQPSPENRNQQREEPAEAKSQKSFSSDKTNATANSHARTARKSENKKKNPTHSDNNTDFESAKGKLPLPVAGSFKIVIPYGAHSRPDMPEVSIDNTGIDAQVVSGATVKAVFAGKVAAIYKAQGFGNVVMLRHGDYYTVYANLAHISVKQGQKLRQGQTIGKVASIKSPTLHFEVWKQRRHLNPVEWLQ